MVFEGQDKYIVLVKACLAAVLLPAMDELEEQIESGTDSPEQTDKVMDNIVKRLDMLGFHLDPHFDEQTIVENLGFVVKMFEEDRDEKKASEKEKTLVH